MDDSTTNPEPSAPSGTTPTTPLPRVPAAGAELPAPVPDAVPGTGAAGVDGGVDAAVGAGTSDDGADGPAGDSEAMRVANAKKRRRGSRGGRRRKPPGAVVTGDGDDDSVDDAADDDAADDDVADDVADDSVDDGADPPDVAAAVPARQNATKRAARPTRDVIVADDESVALLDAQPELPERATEGRISDAAVAERVLVPRAPQIGDTRPAPTPAVAKDAAPPAAQKAAGTRSKGQTPKQPRGRQGAGSATADAGTTELADAGSATTDRKKRRRPERPKRSPAKSAATAPEIDQDVLERRRGKERNGRPVGRYLMCVQARESLTQVAVLEGRSLIEHYVSRPADDVSQIHGNIYLGRVQNVLPGMEAAFVDISTPKNAVLYRGDVQYDSEDILERGDKLRIEQMLKSRQMIVSQVTKNPIGAKGARLTQEVSLPGRFVVLIPNSKTYGISKRLPDDERKRLRSILDRVKPAEHGLIVRTAAENATEEELQADVMRLAATWADIEKRAAQARRANQARLLYREPELAVRVIREEFNAQYRGVVIDDRRLFEDVKSYIEAMNPELADRVEFYDAEAEGLSMFERFHIHEQLHKALDRKVWLPSGGSLIIEHTEALTVIDVNTGKNVGTSN
ncbi:MAG TPA: ribonuclease E/G, partial [Ilumatobacteraceae bacterium]